MARALRRGWTTGACAAAAAKAAWQALTTGSFPDSVSIRLPGGQEPSFALSLKELGAASARAGVVKDAGDDPDVTHGATVIADVARGSPGSGVVFRAGEGVGTVTRLGLPLAVGEPAINPAPRRMIAEAIGHADAVVTISIPGGEELARKTLNGRLGIVGGLSVLGTTGIVVPYSCSSWIASIHQGIDVARAAGVDHIAAATGNTSEKAVQRLYDLPDVALIDMGDFVGGTLKYLRRRPVPRLTIAGGFGKLAKLAQGHLDLHSSRSQVDVALLRRWFAELGGPDSAAESAAELLAAATARGLAAPLSERVATGAREVVMASLAGKVAVDVAVFDRAGDLLARSGP